MAQYLINSIKQDGEMVTVDATVNANFDKTQATVNFVGSVHVKALAKMALYQQKLVLANTYRTMVDQNLPKLASETDREIAIKEMVKSLDGETVDFASPSVPLPADLRELLIDCPPQYRDDAIALYRAHGAKIAGKFLDAIA